MIHYVWRSCQRPRPGVVKKEKQWRGNTYGGYMSGPKKQLDLQYKETVHVQDVHVGVRRAVYRQNPKYVSPIYRLAPEARYALPTRRVFSCQ